MFSWDNGNVKGVVHTFFRTIYTTRDLYSVGNIFIIIIIITIIIITISYAQKALSRQVGHK